MRFEDLLRDTAAAARKEALAEGTVKARTEDIFRAFSVLEESGMDSEAIFSMLSEIFAESPDQIKRIIAGHSD